jgi:ferritin-like metal-binding protein YciE/nicotinamidase-related amidase
MSPGLHASDQRGDVLLLVDLFDDFAHEDGEALLASLAARRDRTAMLLASARFTHVPVVYANDNKGVWDGEAARLRARALEGPGGPLLRDLVPVGDERFVVKPRYSAFDLTPLELILEELGCERLVLAGMTTEGCVAQSAIAARELGLKVTVVAGACASSTPAAEQTALRYLVDVVGVKVEDAAPWEVGLSERRAGIASAQSTKEFDVSEISSPRDLFLHELGDILYVERKLADEVLPKLIGEVQDGEFKAGLEKHLEQTKQHVTNVEEVFRILEEQPHEEECIGFEGLKKEHDELLKQASPSLVDSVDLGAAARTENYEIAAYEGLRRMAMGLGEDDAVTLLDENLAQEKEALREVEKISTRISNEASAVAGSRN